MSAEILSDPVELAMTMAVHGFKNQEFDETQQDVKDLIVLDYMAEKAGLMGEWTISATRAFLTPAEFEADSDVVIQVFNRLNFKGEFGCYSRVAVGRLVGRRSVRALCMTFGEGIIISPSIEELDEGMLLHVPIFATDEVSRPADYYIN